MENPQDTLNGIYDFLKIERHQNNFNEIKQIHKQDDLNAYKIFGLHDMEKKLKNPSTKPEDYLSEYIIGRYGNALDFLWGN